MQWGESYIKRRANMVETAIIGEYMNAQKETSQETKPNNEAKSREAKEAQK